MTRTTSRTTAKPRRKTPEPRTTAKPEPPRSPDFATLEAELQDGLNEEKTLRRHTVEKSAKNGGIIERLKQVAMSAPMKWSAGKFHRWLDRKHGISRQSADNKIKLHNNPTIVAEVLADDPFANETEVLAEIKSRTKPPSQVQQEEEDKEAKEIAKLEAKLKKLLAKSQLNRVSVDVGTAIPVGGQNVIVGKDTVIVITAKGE